jgi:hypothetical protein
MTDQSNTNITTTLTHETTPTFVEMLHFAGLGPETWAALPNEQKLEWLRAWTAKHAEAAQ